MINRKRKNWKKFCKLSLVWFGIGTVFLMFIRNGFFIATLITFYSFVSELNHIELMENLNNE